ncbi:MAG: cell division protein SepF [Methermicoccaceae archaeon]
MPNFIEKLFKPVKKEAFEDDFVEISTHETAEMIESAPASMYVKIADLVSLNDISEVKRQVYENNVVIVNMGPMGSDKLARERIIRDLKSIVEDVGGDIVGIGDGQLILTPSGVKVDRNKISGLH